MNLLKKRWFQVGSVGVLVGVDLVTKFMAAGEGSVLNFGGVFGSFQGGPWGWAAVGILLIVIWEWWRTCQVKVQWGMVLIMAGGFGNLIDRLVYGGVRDFIYYPVLNVYGNVADIYLTVGVLWLAYVVVSEGWKQRQLERST